MVELVVGGWQVGLQGGGKGVTGGRVVTGVVDCWQGGASSGRSVPAAAPAVLAVAGQWQGCQGGARVVAVVPAAWPRCVPPAQAYERGIALFRWPNVADIWHTYLSKFVGRYGGRKLERARDLFEQALDGCPPKYAKSTGQGTREVAFGVGGQSRSSSGRAPNCPPCSAPPGCHPGGVLWPRTPPSTHLGTHQGPRYPRAPTWAPLLGTHQDPQHPWAPIKPTAPLGTHLDTHQGPQHPRGPTWAYVRDHSAPRHPPGHPLGPTATLGIHLGTHWGPQHPWAPTWVHIGAPNTTGHPSTPLGTPLGAS